MNIYDSISMAFIQSELVAAVFFNAGALVCSMSDGPIDACEYAVTMEAAGQSRRELLIVEEHFIGSMISAVAASMRSMVEDKICLYVSIGADNDE